MSKIIKGFYEIKLKVKTFLVLSKHSLFILCQIIFEMQFGFIVMKSLTISQSLSHPLAPLPNTGFICVTTLAVLELHLHLPHECQD